MYSMAQGTGCKVVSLAYMAFERFLGFYDLFAAHISLEYTMAHWKRYATEKQQTIHVKKSQKKKTFHCLSANATYVQTMEMSQSNCNDEGLSVMH